MPNENLKKFEGSGETGNFKHLFLNWKVAKITLMSWNLWWVIFVDVGQPRKISKAVNNQPYVPPRIRHCTCIRKPRGSTRLIRAYQLCLFLDGTF